LSKKPPKLRPDAAEIAYRVMLEATGQAPKTVPPSQRTEKNQEAAMRGRAGGKKGGKARARKLSPAARSKIASEAARARWAKRPE
jgi:hypothetical protein